jgi:hypothetical protein
MKRQPRTSLLAAAVAGVLLASTTQAAVVLNDGVDGTWGNAGQAGRGAAVDYIPLGDGTGVLFTGVFSYDASGAPVWVTLQPVFAPGQTTATDVDVNAFSGGNFGNPATTPTGAVVGSATVTLASCDSLTIALDMDADSGLSDVTLELSPGQTNLGLAAPAFCTEQDLIAECPAGTTANGDDCDLPSTISDELILPAGKNYIVNGRVSVEEGGKLSVAPGVTVIGGGTATSPNFISVKAGGQIFAEGTRDQPITFTGPEAFPGSWAGLVIAGRSICNDGTEAEPCQFEAVPDITYGAVPPVLDDNSGVLRYVRILWAGQQIAPNEELNSLTLLAVGNGTVMEYVQVDGGLDDGYEMFGGSVNGRHLVCSNMGDDCFDFDQGYQGKLQFGLGVQGINPDLNSDSNGFETDNDSSNNDKLPRTQPSVSNFTMVGAPTGTRDGMRIRRGAGGTYANMVVTGYTRTCLNLDDAGTFGLGSAAAQGENFTFTSSFIGGCGVGIFDDAAGDPYAVSAWYGAGAGNGTGDPLLDGYLPSAASPVLTGGQAPADAFFRPTSYRGAFASPNDNWTAGWTVNLPTE